MGRLECRIRARAEEVIEVGRRSQFAAATRKTRGGVSRRCWPTPARRGKTKVSICQASIQERPASSTSIPTARPPRSSSSRSTASWSSRDYVLTGRSEATAAEEAGAEIDPTPGRHPPLPDGPETIELPHRNPRNARVLRIDPDGKNAKIEFVNRHGERVDRGVCAWLAGAGRRQPNERGLRKVLDRPPIAIYGRHPKDPRWRQ